MSRTREDLVAVALRLLDPHGLADVSMRRVAGELELQPSALYHHVASKQELLAAVADEVLRRGARPRGAVSWDDRVVEVAHELRDAMLAYRDGAELVSTVIAFGLGATRPLEDLTAALTESGLPESLVPTAARTVLHLVLGHTLEEQTHLAWGSWSTGSGRGCAKVQRRPAEPHGAPTQVRRGCVRFRPRGRRLD